MYMYVCNMEPASASANGMGTGLELPISSAASEAGQWRDERRGCEVGGLDSIGWIFMDLEFVHV
jgi:hypothetical protein